METISKFQLHPHDDMKNTACANIKTQLRLTYKFINKQTNGVTNPLVL
jgi:hypothetical protein